MKTERTTTTTSNGRGPDACTNVQDGRDGMMVPGRKNGRGSRGTRLPSWAAVQTGEHASGSGDRLRGIPEKNPGKFPVTIREKILENTMGKFPVTIREKIPEKIMGKFPVTIQEKIPEKIMGKFPVKTSEKIPEKIPGKTPETIKGKIPGGELHGVPAGIGIMRRPGGGPA